MVVITMMKETQRKKVYGIYFYQMLGAQTTLARTIRRHCCCKNSKNLEAITYILLRPDSNISHVCAWFPRSINPFELFR